MDAICLAAADDDDVSASVYVKSGGVVSSSTLYTRSTLSYTVQVIAGTPAATPSAPSTPAGWVKIAECAVPAVSGDVVVTDTRTVLQLSTALGGPPGSIRDGVGYHDSWVPLSADLQVSLGSFPDVDVTAGTAHIYGRRYTYDADTVTLPSSNGQYFVIALADGTLSYCDAATYSLDGPLAEVALECCVLELVTVSGGAFSTYSDKRRFHPYSGRDQIADYTMPAKKLDFNIVQASLTVNAEVSGWRPQWCRRDRN